MQERQSIIPADPIEFGFGTELMKMVKVCRHCGNSEMSSSYVCSKCGEKLPRQTLFQIYQQMHRTCALCDTVVSGYMKYCPHCGMSLERE